MKSEVPYWTEHTAFGWGMCAPQKQNAFVEVLQTVKLSKNMHFNSNATRFKTHEDWRRGGVVRIVFAAETSAQFHYRYFGQLCGSTPSGRGGVVIYFESTFK